MEASIEIYMEVRSHSYQYTINHSYQYVLPRSLLGHIVQEVERVEAPDATGIQ